MFRNKQKARRGAVMMFSVFMIGFVVIPSVGLAVDVGIIYSVKSRLQTAVDGAAVAAARGLSRGVGLANQQSSAIATAQKYFAGNMPTGWMGITPGTPTISFPTPSLPRTTVVEVTAGATVPTYFMKAIGLNSINLTATAASTRRDVNIIMVLDRSGSLENSGSCDDLREAAKLFVDQFVDGRDRVGMVTFGTTYRVDFSPAQDFKSRTGTTLPSMIDNIICIGGTNSPSAYWKGYQELVTINESGALNVILFFTDGKPNAIHMPALEIKSTSSCTSKADRNGVITPAGSSVWGILLPIETQAPPAPNPDWRSIASNSGCAWASNFANVKNDVVSLARAGAANEVDVYGNSLTGYKTPINRDSSSRIRIDDVTTVTNASINALVNASDNARVDSINRGLNVVTYTIGLGGPGQAEDEMMRRIANSPESPVYNSARPIGMYAYADDRSQLQQLFQMVASDVLRISK